ncbi:MAG TPA: bifunctional 5,10-methylenetetrahydrofolate dehydrogenase/5,10-methenyltetrahydrofolate cyclohydrolase [Candidatus Saccharimonadales bacterium]|nr:bifunctional 5,10-methylenetetrahydrofolate dehydrogenase/5,10-methenyltetrahydrofolate cyclohydrolase [Candidatus Saccharimonadales bacterium]
MLLDAKKLLAERELELRAARKKITIQPGLALIWVGDDPATAAFIRAKERLSKKLDCQFFLHHFEAVETRQLAALIKGLNTRKDIHGIVLQLPLPKHIDTQKLIDTILPAKDVDNLQNHIQKPWSTPQGIIDLLRANNIDPATRQTIILGEGRLVGAPLAELFRSNGWSFEQISSEAEKHAHKIRQHDLLIACTGVPGLVSAEMVNSTMVVVDGSGVDVEAAAIEKLVTAITPTKGAVGPLTVTQLFANLLQAASG